MNRQLAEAALDAIANTETEAMPGYCQRWVRQVVQKIYGRQFDRFFAASAADSAERWTGSPFAIIPPRRFQSHASQIGDILYKTATSSGRHGHVGIRVPGNLVAENSSCHTSERDRDARGLRTLTNFARFDLIIRLPEK